ncbi:lysine--trna ligase, cytoplasmic [Nicotiana attenuata]|uniref:Lysine--trna ligase, cytoplasmic n=1 Tax=Nicotiana attenuata TaxID=49451 RepID=A0A1J6K850_NICAT|nr:lysine--trna ligase, cytoplasmic [Nicotiana attenuata]OIT26197.1 lysine--trna ligase, cytoplasmic [Nicotiana attenuata]
MLFCYDLENEGATVQVKSHVSDSLLTQYEFTKFHSGLKLGDAVGIVGLPGNRNRGGVTIYPRSFVVLSRRRHMLPLQKGARPLDTTKAALRVSQNTSIVTTADHRAGKIEAEFYDDKVVLEGSQNASIITTTDHRARKFEAESS